ncbi:MAG: hypothetical protein INR68_11890 [Methylobacterium mesophilicum]|nr:hypothetical protein [Methylobacterium mesophilicum]
MQISRRRSLIACALGLALAATFPAFAQQGGGPGGGGPGGFGGGPGDAPDGSRGSRGGFGSDRPLFPAPPPERERDPLPDFGAGGDPGRGLQLPNITGYAPQQTGKPLSQQGLGSVTLSAKMTETGGDISRGLVWRVFKPEPNQDGKLPLVASARGGTSTVQIEPGSYLIHASFGRAGATKRITVGRQGGKEALVLDAGGLELNAVVPGGGAIDPSKLKFSIYEGKEGPTGERALIVPDVAPATVVRLNSGVYHIVSTYGAVNAVARSDIRVEAGKLTQATVEHRAGQVTFKLVREAGGEAMADTAWSILTDGGDSIREAVGPYASMVLAEGDYVVIAKNRDRIYQRELTVKPGDDEEVDVLANEESSAEEGAE